MEVQESYYLQTFVNYPRNNLTLIEHEQTLHHLIETSKNEEKIQAPIQDKRYTEMTDWTRHQQSARMTTQDLQATLQDLLYNNGEPITNL